MKVPEKYRINNHPMLDKVTSIGNNGCFAIPHHKIAGYFYYCLASDGLGWQHVSITIHKRVSKIGRARKMIYGTVANPGGVNRVREIIDTIEPVERCPNWEEMCYVKDQFWDSYEAVMQIHPPEKDYVSMHHYCLHLWKPDAGFPLPDPLMVGIPHKQMHL